MKKSEKPQEAMKLADLVKQYKVIALLNMHSMPGKQLQDVRELLRGKAVIRMSKKSILKRALESAKLPTEFVAKARNEIAIMVSNENPFKLYRFIDENKSPAAAKIGEIARKDIIVQKASTGLPPGPAITTLQKVGLKTTVQDGKIAVTADKVVCKEGEAVTADMASVFSLLKMEPMEIGLDMIACLEEGVIYDKSVLAIDRNKYLADMNHAISQAINLSINADYPTPMTIRVMIQKSFLEAKAVAIDANVLEPEIIGDILAKAVREARALTGSLPDAPAQAEQPSEPENNADVESNVQ